MDLLPPLIRCLTLFLLHRKDNQGFGKMVMNWLVHLHANSGGLTKTNMIEQHFQKYITVPSKDKIEAIFWGSNELYEIMQTKIASYLKSEYAFQGPYDFDFVKVTQKKRSVLRLAEGTEYNNSVVMKLTRQGFLYIQMQ